MGPGAVLCSSRKQPLATNSGLTKQASGTLPLDSGLRPDVRLGRTAEVQKREAQQSPGLSHINCSTDLIVFYQTALPIGLTFGGGRNFMDAEVGALVFLFLIEA